MTPAGALMIEHRLIERMVALMGEQLARVRSQHDCDPDFIGAAVDFIRSYADRCHHGKEEDILFRELAERPLDEPLQTILHELVDEHMRSRQATGRLADANERYQQGDGEALAEIAERLEELVSLYPAHIAKEDKRFFVPAQKCFSESELAAMLERFREFDRQLFHARYREVVDRWEGAEHPQ
ncbi:MAG: hemerythrin domain-containing protein [Armatimonadetes bacterium]|nr:hemerythrin domain-containing protein [Armatimonadota bacterium]